MKLEGVLLRFTRATRDGNLGLYLSSFSEMLPWFALYGHTNYTRWGTIFLADMRELAYTAPDVHSGFLGNDFVVKESHVALNQIPDDQGLEHVNKMGKIAGGLTGITRSDGARDRCCLTYNERANLAQHTRVMFL